MSALLLTCMAVFAVGVQIDFAPDQPLPYVYADDPLIVELQSDTDTKATTRIVIEGGSAPAFEQDLGEIILRSNGTRWISVDGAPQFRGPFTAHVTVTTPTGAYEASKALCRVDRPGNVINRHLVAMVTANDKKTQLALRNVPVHYVHIDIASEDAGALAESLSKMGFELVVNVALNKLPESLEPFASLVNAIAPNVARWDLEPGENPDRLLAITDILTKASPRKPIALVVSTPEMLGLLLGAGHGKRITDLVLQSESTTFLDVDAFRKAAESAGYEGLTLHARTTTFNADANGWDVYQHLLAQQAAGIVTTELSAELLYRDPDCQPAYPYISALSHRFDGAVYTGMINVGSGATARVFRLGANWLAVLSADAVKSVTLPVGNASQLALSDALGNAQPAPEVADGKCTVSVAREPIVLSGSGGDLLAIAAWATLRRESEELISTSYPRASLPAEIFAIAEPIAKSTTPASNRNAYFALLKALPEIEERWHAGTLSREVAAPVIANVSRIAMAMSIVEQERGEPFIDPLVETLGRASEYQSQYLTGASDTNDVHERGDWLLLEISKLVAESKELADNGRPIEGHAIGALAEWRARSLSHAAKAAPLSEPEPQRPDAIAAPVPVPVQEMRAPEDEIVATTEAQPEPEPANEPKAAAKEHVVAKGDTPMGIAKKYKVELNDLMKWNKWKKTPTLRIGQRVVVSKPE